MKGGHVYIMTNKRDGTLYVGVTADLARRAFEHREGLIDGFTKQYGLKRLVYYEFHEDIYTAIQREKTIKHWSRLWKLALIQEDARRRSFPVMRVPGSSPGIDLRIQAGKAADSRDCRRLGARIKSERDALGGKRESL